VENSHTGQISSQSGFAVDLANPYLFLQPLMLATSNLVHSLNLRNSVLRTTF